MKKRMAAAGSGMLALMVSGVLFLNSSVYADHDFTSGRQHFEVHGPYSSHSDDHALPDFLGMTHHELHERMSNGEHPQEILIAQGKTHNELIDFMIEHRNSHIRHGLHR